MSLQSEHQLCLMHGGLRGQPQGQCTTWQQVRSSQALVALQACEERFNRSKMVHSIMRHVAETTGQNLEELYSKIAWPLYKLYGHAFEAFKVMSQDPEPLFAKLQVGRSCCCLTCWSPPLPLAPVCTVCQLAQRACVCFKAASVAWC